MNANTGVSCSGSARDEGNPRPLCHRAICAGHKGRSALLTARDRLNAGLVMQSIEDCQEALPWNGKDPVCALISQTFYQQFSGSFWSGGQGSVLSRFCPRLAPLFGHIKLKLKSTTIVNRQANCPALLHKNSGRCCRVKKVLKPSA